MNPTLDDNTTNGRFVYDVVTGEYPHMQYNITAGQHEIKIGDDLANVGLRRVLINELDSHPSAPPPGGNVYLYLYNNDVYVMKSDGSYSSI